MQKWENTTCENTTCLGVVRICDPLNVVDVWWRDTVEETND